MENGIAAVKNAWRKLRRAGVFVCACTGLIFLLATFSPFVSWYARRLAGPWEDPRGETLIVLAGNSLEGFPEENTILRCMYAVFAYKAGEYRRIVVSGEVVAPHMKNLLIAEGVPAEAVIVEDKSHSTRENALFVTALLRGVPGRHAVLTSDYHMFRAIRTFRKAGLKAAPWPIPDALKRVGNRLRRWPAFLDEATESVKILYYKYQGWI